MRPLNIPVHAALIDLIVRQRDDKSQLAHGHDRNIMLLGHNFYYGFSLTAAGKRAGVDKHQASLGAQFSGGMNETFVRSNQQASIVFVLADLDFICIVHN